MQDSIAILLVDDEPRNLDALEAILDVGPYQLLRAENADKALRLLLENDVAAIVLDIKMPGVSGFELAQLIKGTKRFREIPILFLTAHMVDDSDVLTGYDAGAVDYLTKPANPAILRQKVAVFADLFRKTRALAELNETLELRVQQRTADLEKSEAALREANRQKDLFLATLAHELRNPLAPLRTGVDVLLRQPDRPATMDRTLGAMNRQLDHMVRLIDDLLDVSRISRGTLDVRKESAELTAVIHAAIETASPAFAKRSQKATLDTLEPVQAFVDGTRISQIVGNLLNNASIHSPAGSEVRVRLRRDGAGATIQVIDQGMGIPSDQLARVFDMFTKIRRREGINTEGLGIGLALSRQLAELHNGTLTAESAGEGKGATFTLSIPTGTVARAQESTTRDGEAAPRKADKRAGLRVVVVEDNEDSAEMTATWLEHLGHHVQVAHTGPDGVALILDARPDVVLCDMGLPGMEGVDVCRHVLREMASPPVMVAMTGWGMDSDRKRTSAAGFQLHLVKPVDPHKLQTILESIETNRAGVPNAALVRDEVRSPG
jgi:signal transduction histidine kinase